MAVANKSEVLGVVHLQRSVFVLLVLDLPSFVPVGTERGGFYLKYDLGLGSLALFLVSLEVKEEGGVLVISKLEESILPGGPHLRILAETSAQSYLLTKAQS